MNRVSELMMFVVDGSTQYALVRGSADGPVVLLVQSGPGFPMIQEADALEARLGLEATHRVVYWDQRGTGRSFDPSDSGPLSVERLAADVVAMTEQLCLRLGVAAVDVAGFSLGGTTALLACATDAGRSNIRRVVAVGPDVDLAESEAYALQFAKDEAVRRGHRRALRELEQLGPGPCDTPERFMTRVKWVSNFGGIEGGTTFLSLFFALLGRLIRSPHYSWRQVVRAVQGMQRTQARVLQALGAFKLNLRRLAVPVTVIQGRLDAAAPPHVTARFVEALDAPAGKRLVWFERSAHSPHYEEPERFRQELHAAFSR